MSLTTLLLFFGGQQEDRGYHDARRPRYFMLLSVVVVLGGLALAAVVKALLDFLPGHVADAKFEASGDPALPAWSGAAAEVRGMGCGPGDNFLASHVLLLSHAGRAAKSAAAGRSRV